jgi:hypothetical protein
MRISVLVKMMTMSAIVGRSQDCTGSCSAQPQDEDSITNEKLVLSCTPATSMPNSHWWNATDLRYCSTSTSRLPVVMITAENEDHAPPSSSCKLCSFQCVSAGNRSDGDTPCVIRTCGAKFKATRERTERMSTTCPDQAQESLQVSF